jgi:hypothetical protein
MVIGSRGLRWACLLVALTLAAPALAQEKPAVDPQRLAAARELMVAAGSARQFDQVMPVLTANMTKAFVALAPQAEPHIREIMGELLKRFSDRKGELIDQIAAAYAEKLSLDELKELTRFYSTGVGAKFIAVMPELMQQSMALGQRWGESIGREIDEELRRELKKRGINI